jgi:hypothetical protein
VRLNNVITGFPISRNGSFDLTIEYMPQRWFVLGLAISLVSLGALLLALLAIALADRRRAGDVPKQETELAPEPEPGNTAGR